MEAFLKAQGYKGSDLRKQLETLGFSKKGQRQLKGMESGDADLEADLAWHVRAWGQWVLNQARQELARFYPVYADFEPVRGHHKVYEKKEMRRVPLRKDGTPDTDALNRDFGKEYLRDKSNPRWVAKPTVAYLWARTVVCKNCRATVPLLKTRWLCKKANKRVRLTMKPNAEKTGVVFGIENDVPVRGGNAAQRRENDKKIGAGTMSRSGAKCPCCGAIMTMEDIRLEGQAGRLGKMMTAVSVQGQKNKEYRLVTSKEQQFSEITGQYFEEVFAKIPFGLPEESTPAGGGRRAARAFSVQGYGLMRWCDLYTSRQLTTLGVLAIHTYDAIDNIKNAHYSDHWINAIGAYLACTYSRTIDYMSNLCVWENGAQEVKHVFMRWALPITWDFAEANPLSPVERFYIGGMNSAQRVLSLLHRSSWNNTVTPKILNKSAIEEHNDSYDLIFTDPPYYDAIPYSDLMDFFYVWLRRTIHGLNPLFDKVFEAPLSPKWNNELKDGELIDDDSRHGGDTSASKKAYEDGMYKAFLSGYKRLAPDGYFVVVFANKNPDAWETLVASVIRAGFCVVGSWPIATEMPGGLRNLGRASLASSVWLVCKKRPPTARPGWDNKVLETMRTNIQEKLRNFWDAGIRGPDFVWAATGPALEAYSKHPVVKKANESGKIMTVSEFLRHVRRIVVDFVVGRVLFGDAEKPAIDGELDNITAYYLLHRNDFGIAEAPAGTCILYAVSCGLSDTELAGTWDILARTGGSKSRTANADPDDVSETGSSSGSKVKLKTWAQRKRKIMGHEAPGGKPVPLIDRTHRLMHLWKAGDAKKSG